MCSALAAADAQLVGRVSCRKHSRSRRTLAGAVAHERCAAPTERIARGMNARCAVCGLGRRFLNPGAYEGPWYGVWFSERGSAERCCRIVSAHVPHASLRRCMGAPAQPAHAADRCAREIVRILADDAQRLRRLMGNPLGAIHQCLWRAKCSWSWYTIGQLVVANSASQESFTHA